MAAATPFNPFPGLRAFDRSENDRFFGREEHVDELLRRLRGHRFVAVIGASGSGKSSLVRAGMLPALEGGFMVRAGSDWRIAVMRPGSDPIGQLAEALTRPEIFGDPAGEGLEADLERELDTDLAAAALRRSRHGLVQATREARMQANENLLVVVDQFEELFRYRDRLRDRQADEAVSFVRLLLTASEEPQVPIYVVLTMRSDFLGDCAQLPGLPEAINESQYLVPRLDRRQLERVIRGPIGVGGGRIAGPLLQRLLNDVGDNPDQLPILQHALMRTFDRWLAGRRGDEPIGLDHYRAIGGMEEALSRHADEAYAEVEPALRPLTERIFKSLTERGADGRGVRRPTPLADLAAIAGAGEDDVRRVVDVFRAPGRTFLTPSLADRPRLDGEQVVDVSHESLMRVWTRLVRWVDQEAESARIYRRLAETAALYPDEAALWRHPELEIAQRWRRTNQPTAAWAERHGGGFDQAVEFLEQSQRAWDEERRAERARQLAERSKRLAFDAERALPDDHELATLLAIEAGRASPTAEAEWALRLVLDHPGRSLARLTGHADQVVDVACWAPPGGEAAGVHLASASLNGEVFVWRGPHFERPHALEGHTTTVRLAWSPGGRRLASAGIDGTARLWDAADGRLLHLLGGHEAGISDLAWDAAGERLATAGLDRTVRVWDAASGEPLNVLHGHQDWVLSVAWHGGRLASAGGDASGRVWEPATGAEIATLSGHVDRVVAIAWSPDGRRLATAGNDATARVWEAASGEQLAVLAGHGDWVTAVAWAGDGRRLLTASRDGTARVWRLAAEAGGERLEGREVARFAGHEGEVLDAAWSGDGRRVLTAGRDATARVWEVASGRQAAVLTGHRAPVRAARWVWLGGSTQSVVTGSEDRSLRLWSPQPGYLEIPRRGSELPEQGLSPIWEARFGPHGERVASAHRDGAARVWDAGDGRLAATLTLPPATGAPRPEPGPLLGVGWSPGGERLLVYSRDHRAAVWELASGEARVFTRHRSAVRQGAFDPTGQRIATASLDGGVHVWRPDDPEGGGDEGGDHGGGVISLAWSPDGRRLLTAGDDSTLAVWELNDDAPLVPRRVHTFEGHLSAVLHAAWAPDGRRVASVGMDQTVRLWDAGDGRLLRTWTGHRGWTVEVAWHPAGRRLASSGRDGTVRLWDSHGDEDAPLALLAGHRQSVRSIRFDADGERLLSASQDGTVNLWHVDPESGRGHRIACLAEHGDAVLGAAWSPAGDRVLTASLDGTMRVYLTRLPDMVAAAEARAVRAARREEEEQYGLPPSLADATALKAVDEPADEERLTTREMANVVLAEPGRRPFRVAGIVFADNEWAREIHRGMEAGRETVHRRYGVEIELPIHHHQFDLASEIALIDRYVDEGADAIVISPRDLDASVPAIRRAHENGVVVVCVGTSINLNDAERYVASFYESDQFELGFRTGQYLAQWLAERGLDDERLELGIVQCERFEQCYERGQGFRAGLANAGIAWREVSNVEGLVFDEAQRRAEQMLAENEEILVVFGQHDESTRGAVEAVRKLGLAGKVFVFGTDIADSIAQMLRADDGVLQATTGQQARQMGERGVVDAVRALVGKDLGPLHKVLASPLYTREPWDAHKLAAWDDAGDAE